jgi:hypothetical protein
LIFPIYIEFLVGVARVLEHTGTDSDELGQKILIEGFKYMKMASNYEHQNKL